jgi:hypothetical protein
VNCAVTFVAPLAAVVAGFAAVPIFTNVLPPSGVADGALQRLIQSMTVRDVACERVAGPFKSIQRIEGLGVVRIPFSSHSCSSSTAANGSWPYPRQAYGHFLIANAPEEPAQEQGELHQGCQGERPPVRIAWFAHEFELIVSAVVATTKLLRGTFIL